MAVQMVEVTPNERTPARRNAEPLPVIDTDVHHGVRDKEDLYPYLTPIYRQRLADFGLPGGTSIYHNNGGVLGRRSDSLDPDDPDDKTATAINVTNVRKQLLDGCGIHRAVLTGSTMYTASSITDLDFASALCSAFNDFTLEHWADADERFRVTLAVCTQDPEGTAREIDRLGRHPAVVGILMPCGATRPFGHRFYHPIYDACARHDLSVVLHFGGEGAGVNPPPTAAGFPSYYIESRLARPSFYQVHLASFVFEGVFERFPTLKVAMAESGFGWIPSYLWRMDSDWKGLRPQTPWIKRPPSEIVTDHVRFASQPVDDPEVRGALEQTIQWMDGEKLLMFASDHPHWDWDHPAEVLTELPSALRRRIFVDNGRDAFPRMN